MREHVLSSDRDRDCDVLAVDRAVRGAVAAAVGHRRLTAGVVGRGGVVGGDEAAGGVVGGLPLLHPLDGRGRAAGDARAPRHRLPRRVLREEPLEYHPVVVGLLVDGRVVGEHLGGVVHHLIRHLLFSEGFETIDPVVANAVTELFFLPVENMLGQVRVLVVVERLPHDPLLDAAQVLVVHFPFGVHAHGDVDELLVEERHADLQAPRRRGLVGAQAVVLVQGFHLAAGLPVELLLVGGEVEVEVAAQELVGALPGQHHLHAQRLDLASHQEHGRAGPDRRHVVRLVVVDHLLDRVDAVLYGEVELVMDGSEVVSDLSCGLQVRGALEADDKGVELGAELLGGLGLDEVALGDGGDERGVEAAGEEDPERDVSHEPLDDRLLEGLSEDERLVRRPGHLLLEPVRGVPPPEPAAGAGVEVARREDLEAHAVLVQRLHLGRDPDGTVTAPADVERVDADGVARRHVGPVAGVVEHEREHPVQHVHEVLAVLLVQGDDDLAVTARAEVVCAGELLPDVLVVVDLSIGHHHDGAVLVEQRLVAGQRGDDGEPLLRQEVALVLVEARPVGAPVLQPSGAGEDASPLCLRPVGATEHG